MGVKIPRLEGGRREESLTDYLLEIPVSISEAIKAFQEVHKIVLDVAEKRQHYENYSMKLIRQNERLMQSKTSLFQD